jgi:hypothetical protein
MSEPRLQLSHRSRAGKLLLRLDALDITHDWSRQAFADLTLETPAGIRQPFRLPLTAPGRYEAQLDAPVAGPYRARVELSGHRISRLIHHREDLESLPSPVADWLAAGLEEQRIRPWSTDGLPKFLNEVSHKRALREVWLGLALATFLLLILYERRAALSHILGKSKGERKS